MIKKTEEITSLKDYDEKRVQIYHNIKAYLEAGYSMRQTAKILHCSRNTVTKYHYGDFDALCQKDFQSKADKYYDYIIKSLKAGMSRKDVYRCMIDQGYKGGQTTAYDDMNKLIKRFQIDISIYKSTAPDTIKKRKVLQCYDHITRTVIFRFLWMNTEMTARHRDCLFETYPRLKELYVCIKEFR